MKTNCFSSFAKAVLFSALVMAATTACVASDANSTNIPFMTIHRWVAPSSLVTTNFYGSVTSVVDSAYITAHHGNILHANLSGGGSYVLQEGWETALNAITNGSPAYCNIGSNAWTQMEYWYQTTYQGSPCYCGHFYGYQTTLENAVRVQVIAIPNVGTGVGVSQFTYQQKLVSGTNIKTINGNSVLGSGDIIVEGSSPNVVTNIAGFVSTNVVNDKVAPWAMKGQPQPTGTITDVQTNGVSAVVEGVANINLTGGGGISANTATNIASSASVTNAGAVASAKAYADEKISLSEQWSIDTFAARENPLFYGIIQLGAFANIGIDNNSDLYFLNANGDLSFRSLKSGSVKKSNLIPDNTPIVTSNMLNGVLTPALAQKADRASPATAGNFASLTAQGNLQDSGKKSSDFAPAGTYLKQDGSVYADYLNIKGAAPNYNTGGFSIERNVLTDEYYMYAMIPSKILFHDYNHNQSDLTPDNTPVITQGLGDTLYFPIGDSDFHIVTTSPVTSGQIGNFNLANLTAKTISCSVSETDGKASDILIWTYGNTAECQMTFTLQSGFTLVGDAADTKATANKKCLFSLVKISNTEVIVSKKEYE